MMTTIKAREIKNHVKAVSRIGYVCLDYNFYVWEFDNHLLLVEEPGDETDYFIRNIGELPLVDFVYTGKVREFSRRELAGIIKKAIYTYGYSYTSILAWDLVRRANLTRHKA
jgi:hypothetical protein